MPAPQPAGFVPDGFVADAPAPPPPAPAPAAPVGSVGTRFAEGVWQNMNPAGLVQAVRHPIDTLGAVIDAQVEQIQQAKSLYDQQRYSEAAGHLGAGLLPLVGPAAAKAGERIGSGDVAGGLGEATGLLASIEAPKAVAKVGGAVTDAVASRVAALPAGVASRLAPDLVGLASPRAAHLTRIVQTVRNALSAPEVADVAEAAGPVDPAAPHLDTSLPVKAGDLTPAQLAERIRFGRDVGPRAPVAGPKRPIGVTSIGEIAVPGAGATGPAAASLDVPAGPGAPGGPSVAAPSIPGSPASAPAPTNAFPDQRALNEAALAQRRAAYQARVQAEARAAKGQPQPPALADAIAPDAPTSAAATPAPVRLKLTAPESKEYLRLRQAGLADPDAMGAIQAARDFQTRFGTPTPTAAETRFPKR